jgi:hypothetical protein
VYFGPAVIPGNGNGIASLAVWTAAAGTVTLAPSAPIPASSAATGNGLADVSPDGAQLLFFATQDGYTGTLTVSTPDGKTQVPLVANIDLGVSSGCRPFAQFAGLNILASYCLVGPEPDAGMPEADAGMPEDSGAPRPDSGVVVDATAPEDGGPRDASAVRDATVPPDASPDASRDAAVADSSGAPPDARAADSAAVDAAPDVGAADTGASDVATADVRPAGAPMGGTPFGGSPFGNPFDASPFGSTPTGGSPFGGPPNGGRPFGGNPFADASIFAGVPANNNGLGRGRAVFTVTRETPDASAGNPLATIATFSGPDFTQSVLVSDTPSTFAIDPSGNHVLVMGPSGAMLYPIGGGAGVAVDTAGIAGVFTRDGANVVYVTRATALKRSPVADPTPQTLVVSGLGGLFGLSPDQTWVLAYRSLATGGQTSDLLLAPATMEGNPRPLTASNEAAIYGDAFTVDSKFVLYFDHIAPATGGGNFYVAGVSGKAPAFVASNAWVAAATSGSKALVSANCATCSSSTTGAADLLAFDANEPKSVKTLVSQAYATFYLTSDRNQVVYSWTCASDPRAGIYALPVP